MVGLTWRLYADLCRRAGWRRNGPALVIKFYKMKFVAWSGFRRNVRTSFKLGGLSTGQLTDPGSTRTVRYARADAQPNRRQLAQTNNISFVDRNVIIFPLYSNLSEHKTAYWYYAASQIKSRARIVQWGSAFRK